MTHVDQFITQYELEKGHIYLLELIPLIKMIWADGKSQDAEIAILKHFATTHLAELTKNNEGLLPVTVESTNKFLERFTQQAPSEQMLQDLMKLCTERLLSHPDIEYSRLKSDQIIDFCIDIAAACASVYPYDFDERVVTEEKRALRELIATLG